MVLIFVLLYLLPVISAYYPLPTPGYVANYSLPFSTSSRDIVDSTGKKVKLSCVNWPTHLDTMLAEGLNKQSSYFIGLSIKEMGFNCVRLSYATEMVINSTVTVHDSFIQAAGRSNNTVQAFESIYTDIRKHNPFITETTTRLDAFEHIVDVLDIFGIFVVLDNHVSRAMWCCAYGDGNDWWGERYFNTDEWVQGLSFLAEWSLKKPNVIGMDLRNELRLKNNLTEYYENMNRGAHAINAKNKDLLIVFSGLISDLDLSSIRTNPFLDFKGKTVYEFHWYAQNYNFYTCEQQLDLGKQWFLYILEPGQNYTSPLWMSEFGFDLNTFDATTTPYWDCTANTTSSYNFDWAYWVLAGSYYVREGKLDYDESYGLLTKDWSAPRSQKFLEAIKPLQ